MKGDKARDYLEGYLERSAPPLNRFLKTKTKEAERVGKIPGQLASYFAKLSKKGKRIRGALVELGYLASGGTDKEAIVDASLFVEIGHTGLLIHDDIQDRDELRRGMPSVHSVFAKKISEDVAGSDAGHLGMSLALNVGISAYFWSLERLAGSNFSPDRVLSAAALYAKYIQRVSYGQALDVINVLSIEKNEKELINILKYKSAEYTCVLPLLVGAVLAGEQSKKQMKLLEKYGLALGWAFQIQDDLLGTFGDQSKTGKSNSSDIREGKVTLLVLHLLKHGSEKQKRTLRAILGNIDASEEEVEKARAVLVSSGAREYVEKLAEKYVKESAFLAKKITQEKYLQNVLVSLAHLMVERTS